MSAAEPPPGPPPGPPPATQSMSAAAHPLKLVLKSSPSSSPVLYPTPRMDATELLVGQLQADLKDCRSRVSFLEDLVGELQEVLDEMSTWWDWFVFNSPVHDAN